MAIRVFSDPGCTAHDPGEHPEHVARWERADATLRALAPLPGAPLVFERPAAIAPEALALVHPPEHSARLAAFCAAGGGRLDEDTVASPGTEAAARGSAGAAVAAAAAVLAGPGRQAVALCRPPGHHALPTETMGFCLYNNAALAARWAQVHGGLSRVAILDWDVHHGNGTEAIFADDPTVLFMSLHQHPNWPGTGRPTDIGVGAGRGYTANVRLPLGTGDAGAMQALDEVFGPLVATFRPELVVVSAGFDAHWRDPLGRLGFTVTGYAALMRVVLGWAEELAAGRCVVLLEGGYDVEALAASLGAVVQVLRGGEVEDPLGPSPYPVAGDGVARAIAETRAALGAVWPAFREPQASPR
ncbi:MAG: histone deacetylase [Candidatus Sericytochromatia bacterium]|nr:histone deacetylase [Candidatus Sericytochromatia bacterium]